MTEQQMPSARESATAVWTASWSRRSSRAPKYWLTMTEQPMPTPIEMLMVRSVRVAVAWMAPRVVRLAYRPMTYALARV